MGSIRLIYRTHAQGGSMASGTEPKPVNVLFRDSYNGDILSYAKNMPNDTLSFFVVTDNPANSPSDWNLGGYFIYKANERARAFYLGPEGVAISYSITSSSTALSWTKVT